MQHMAPGESTIGTHSTAPAATVAVLWFTFDISIASQAVVLVGKSRRYLGRPGVCPVGVRPGLR